jgi:coniferyl-aldehyde dehydrogenase
VLSTFYNKTLSASTDLSAKTIPTGTAAKSIAYGKLSNAGQTCIAPDYSLVHKSKIDAFVDAFEAAVRAAYPAGVADEAYSAIISQRHYDRLAALIEDARRKGAKVLQIGEASARKLPPTLIVGATPEMSVMQDEIFGPVLPIIPYKDLDEAIACVNAKPRPLALYVFSDDRSVVRQVLDRTTSGNATVNDTLLHYAQDDLPFGGVGPSGMGAYHGEEGFLSLSHAKGVFIQSRWSSAGLLRAPFGRLTDFILNILLR